MKLLHAPWRDQYANNPNHPSRRPDASSEECVFCTQSNEKNDAQNFILKRFEHCYVMLNKYPYNAGHLLIIPYAHKKTLSDLSHDTRAELMETVSLSTDVLKKTLQCDGINVGINIGEGAGAGIPSHLHIHVLPRWINDTNFMPALADTKVISFDLATMYEQLKKEF